MLHYNNATNHYNNYIQFKNKQFTPTIPDVDLQKMLDNTNDKLDEAIGKLSQINNSDEHTKALLTQLNTSITIVKKQTSDEQVWLNSYLSKNKTKRKSMFYKMTWFGIPIN